MIDRYTRKEMGDLWTVEARFESLLAVEKTVARVEARHGLIPQQAADDIQKGTFNVERILEIEQTTKHDIIAFVSCVAETVGVNGRYIHYGLTSSDALDTALSVQILRAKPVLMASIDRLLAALKKQALENMDVICSGRTHGMHAEPTTFGYKLSGFYYEMRRHKERIENAFTQMAVGKLSGAVGTYSFLSPEIERDVCKELGLKPESVATQVVPRDRHAEVLTALSFLGAGIERLAVEIRHLQRTEVGEAREGFTKGQKGSSAMPHKRNPIGSENLTGCARLLRGYALAAMENIALWHERDISHSSVERVAFPDAFILADYATDRMAKIVENLEIDSTRMKKNMELSQGQLFSSHVLLHMVDKGLSREEAYKIVQALSHGLKEGEQLCDVLLTAKETKEYFTSQDVTSIFSGERHLKNSKKLKETLRGEP
ncbi:MAG: adenylosuccinate lyase [Bdellovibrionaceae bacterium]|nr:adenylosuccinate lyase [Pseudobdellovibrionaceae bacterium]